MDTLTWVIIIVALMIAWWAWSKYGAIYTAINNNPGAIKAGMSINRYATDIMGLIGAYDAQDSTDGSFSSRMGAFFGTLPT
jgi:DNA-binding transcriptional regulator of glucitol operon